MLRGVFTVRRYASAVYAVMWCLSVLPSICLSVRLSRSWIMSKRTNIILEFFSSSGNHTFLVRQNVLQYLNNFTKHHGAVCQRQLSFLWKYSEAMVKKRPFFIPPFHLTCTITYHPYKFFSKILIKTVQVPGLLDGAKILPNSSRIGVGCNSVTDDTQMTLVPYSKRNVVMFA